MLEQKMRRPIYRKTAGAGRDEVRDADEGLKRESRDIEKNTTFRHTTSKGENVN